MEPRATYVLQQGLEDSVGQTCCKKRYRRYASTVSMSKRKIAQAGNSGRVIWHIVVLIENKM